MVYLLKMVIFHSYVSLPEGNFNPATGDFTQQMMKIYSRVSILTASKENWSDPEQWRYNPDPMDSSSRNSFWSHTYPLVN